MIEFDCGCRFEENSKGKPVINPDLTKLRLDCPKTWQMISDGNTKGVFQLESQLGQSTAAKTAPAHMEELSDLIAIIRPGCLEAIVDGKNLTQHYIDRKSGRDTVAYLHPALEPILEGTYGIMIYQEEALGIARQIAGYNLQEAELLRKAIGKKKVELMAKIKEEFLKKSIDLGIINKEEAEEIFSWIEKSQRYSFNKSHSFSYANTGYLTAYIKAHFPRPFFTAWLRHANGKQDPHMEIQDLVNNARMMDIDIMPPSVIKMNRVFKLIDNCPTYGITNIKKVGDSVFDQLRGVVKNNKYDLASFTWDQFLMKLGRFIKRDAFQAMILAGALDYYKINRNKMLYDLEMYREFRDSDHKFLEASDCKTFRGGVEEILYKKIPNERRTAHTDRFIELMKGTISALDNPPYDLVDSAKWRARQEREYLSVELTCTEIDEYDTSDANCSCREYIKGFNSQSISIAAKINDVREWTIKKGKSKGQTMAFLKISDGTCALDNVTMFSEAWEKHREDVTRDSILLFRGSRDQNRGSFLVKRVQKLT